MVLISLNDNKSEITCTYHESIDLDKHYDYEIGLLSFNTYNSIPNISEKLKNNRLYYSKNNEEIEIKFSTGTYEIADIAEFVQNIEPDIEIFTNNNTLKVEILSKYQIDFTKDNCINSLLGFSKQIIPISKKVQSDLIVDIMKVNSIRIKCNIVSGSYENNKLTNIIHEFHINDSPGYKIDEVPKNLIYLPLNTKSIRELNIRVCDQDNNLVDFRNENINIRLHIRKIV